MVKYFSLIDEFFKVLICVEFHRCHEAAVANLG